LELNSPEISSVLTTEDINTVASLAREIWTKHYTPIIGSEQVAYMLDKFQSPSAITKQIADGYYYFVIAQDEPIGYLSIKEEGDTLFISKIYVSADSRGKGYGNRLMRFAIKQANQFGLKILRLTVNKYNTKSIAAYEKMGFSNTIEVVFDIGNGYIMDDYEMMKTI